MRADLEAENRLLRERVAQLEHALETQGDPLVRALLENATPFLNVVTPEGRFLSTGGTGKAFGSVVGKSVLEFIAPESQETVRAALARVCETGQPVWYEAIGYGESGEAGHAYRVRAVPLLEGDRVDAIILVPTDITDRVRLERSLVESKQALQLAVEASGMGLWRWDVAKNEVEWDQRLLEIWGLQETPPDYAAYLERVHPDDRTLVKSVVEGALETGSYPTFEHRLATGPDGQERWVLTAATVIQDANGNATMFVGGVLDITHKKRLEAQLQRAERVEVIGQLAAGISHNFNNLLAVILPNVELAMTGAGVQDRESLEAALEAALQAKELVKSLLALTGRRRNEPREPADPRQVVARVEAICRRTFPREIELVCSVDPEVGAVSMPASDLEQVLLNLLFNARDALEPVSGGERRISVSVERARAPNGTPSVRLRVTDTGIGMTEETRRHAGEPFFTTKPPHRGSGLGLANALARVREADGHLESSSTPGIGTTFALVLPEVARPSSTTPVASSTPAPSQGETILVVDDEPLVSRTLRLFLEGMGHRVVEAESAAQARALLERHGGAVSLVILDQSMPRESGLDALPTLRARTAAPIVLFSGLLPSDLPEGIAAVLEKPARPAEIQQVVEETIGAGKAARGQGR